MPFSRNAPLIARWTAGALAAFVLFLAAAVVAVAEERITLFSSEVTVNIDSSLTVHETIDIVAETANVVRLTLSHTGLEFDSEMYHGIAHGWPRVLSSLKSLIETGHALPITAARPRPVTDAVGAR